MGTFLFVNEGVFKLIVKNQKGVNIFEIEYDFKKEETKLGKFFPPKGSVINDFEIKDFPYWDFLDNSVVYKDIVKKIKLDKDYFSDINGVFDSYNFLFEGEPKLINFIKKNGDEDFFNEIKSELTE